MKKRNKKRNESTLFLVVLVGIIILINILGVRFFLRGDLTDDGIFTLSRASVSLVEKLEDKLIVKAYFTKNLPGRFATLERHVGDLLGEYVQHSDGKMVVEFIDPTGDEEEEKVAKSLGIQKMPNPDIEKDQATVKEGYRGISFSFGEDTEVIGAVESPVGLEYQITSVLKKITGQRETLGFVVGHGEPEISPAPPPGQQQQMMDPNAKGEYRNIRTNLDIYNYRQVDLKDPKGMPADVGALVIGGTREAFSEDELYELDQFLMRGGSLAFFLDGVNVQMEQGQYPGMPITYKTTANASNIKEILGHYGIEVGAELIMDAQSSSFGARCPPIPLPLPRPYPAWPLITSFGEEHPITHRLGSLSFPYVCSVKVSDAARKNDKLKAQELAFSSGNSWSVAADVAVVDPCAMEISKNLESSIPLAATVTGTFTSYYKGKQLPPSKGAAVGTDLKAYLEESKKPGRIVVVGSAGLPTDGAIGYFARMDRRQAINNFTFVKNALDWMTSEDNLIAIRMKTVDDPPIKKKSEGIKTAAKYGNIVGIPFAFILFGLVRWRLRRKSSAK